MIIKDRPQLLSYLNPEQRLLLYLCGKQTDQNIDEAKIWLTKPFNWTKLIALSERHRLLPQLYKSVKEISLSTAVDIPPDLKDRYYQQTEYVIKLASEGLKISDHLTREGISNILLKGPFLSDEIYGDLALRPSRDIDILVLPDFLDQVEELLHNNGYCKVYPDFSLTTKQRNFYQTHKNQFGYRNPNNGILIEVHWRLFSDKNLLSIPTETIFDESQKRIMAGKQIRTLSIRHNLEFLCLHGSIHQWFRLLWLRDIAQILGKEDVNVDQVLSLAQRHNNERPVLQAISLTNHFFGTNYSLSSKSAREVKSIVIHAATAIISDEKFVFSHRIGRFRFPIYKMKLKSGYFYKLGCWSILQPNFNDWKQVKLPDSLFFLYFILRPFIWFYAFYIKKKKTRHKPILFL